MSDENLFVHPFRSLNFNFLTNLPRKKKSFSKEYLFENSQFLKLDQLGIDESSIGRDLSHQPVCGAVGPVGGVVEDEVAVVRQSKQFSLLILEEWFM